MKRKIVSAVSALLMVCCMTGCGEHDEKFTGNWEADRMISGSETITDLSGIPICAFMRFTLKENGSADWIQPMESIKNPSKEGITAKWHSEEGKKAELKISMPEEKDTVMELEYIDGELVNNTDGVLTYFRHVDQFTETDERDMNTPFYEAILGSGN